jgi:phosphomannomutase
MALSDLLGKIDAVVKRDDIRGVFGDNITCELAYDLGLALAETFLDCTEVSPVNIAVGHDMRLSGAALASALCQGLDDGGCRAINIGRTGTELVGFLPAKYGDVIDGGIIITASHNPKDNNGFKFFGRGGAPLTMMRETPPPDAGDELGRVAMGIKKRAVPTRMSWDDVAPDYIATALEKGRCDFDAACAGWSEPLRVAVEAGNGMGGKILAEFAKLNPQFGWTFSNDQPDGAFPILVPNPLKPAFQKMVRELVLETGSHMGICFDGDADRVAVADENGVMLSPPQLTTLVGLRLREKLGPDAKIAYNLATSWMVADTLADREDVLGDGSGVMTPVGYGKIKPIMFSNPAIAFGAEHSGHYLFRDFWCSDSGMLAGLLMIELVAELHGRGETLSSLLVELRARYCESGEINFQLPAERPGREEIDRVSKEYTDAVKHIYVVSGGRVHEVDEYPPPGLALDVNDIRVEFDDWWFCMRTSGTEASGGDLLRLYAEADGDRALMEQKRDALIDLIGRELIV